MECAVLIHISLGTPLPPASQSNDFVLHSHRVTIEYGEALLIHRARR